MAIVRVGSKGQKKVVIIMTKALCNVEGLSIHIAFNVDDDVGSELWQSADAAEELLSCGYHVPDGVDISLKINVEVVRQSSPIYSWIHTTST